MRLLFTIGILLCVLGGIQAQELEQAQQGECQTKLSEAENIFVAGKFYAVPSMLQDCIDRNQFSNEEQVRVYMLLTQAYLLSDDPVNAEESYLKLLAADPEYVAGEAVDPIEVVYLSKKFTTTPIFTPHLKFGPNISSQSVLHKLGPFATQDEDEVVWEYTPQIGLTLGAGIEWNINDNLGLGGEVLFSYKTFRRTITQIWDHDVLEMKERQFWFDVPLYVRYGINLGKFRPYAYGGGALNILFADRLQLQFTDYTANASDENNTEGAQVGVLYKRHLLSGSLVFGGGVKYKWGKNFLLFDVRYMPGLTNVVNIKTVHYDSRETFALATDLGRYANVGETFRVNSLAFTVGYVRPLYDPRRVSKVRTKGVSKKISGE